jgi:hypothetical protein
MPHSKQRHHKHRAVNEYRKQKPFIVRIIRRYQYRKTLWENAEFSTVTAGGMYNDRSALNGYTRTFILNRFIRSGQHSCNVM